MKTMSIKEREQLNNAYAKMNDLSYRKSNAKEELKMVFDDPDACVKMLKRIETIEREHSDVLHTIIELMTKYNLTMAELSFLYASRY